MEAAGRQVGTWVPGGTGSSRSRLAGRGPIWHCLKQQGGRRVLGCQVILAVVVIGWQVDKLGMGTVSS